MEKNLTKQFLGIDVGGTSIKFALVDESGAIDESTRNSIPTIDEKQKVIDDLKIIIEKFPQATAIGVSFPGVVQGRGYLRSAGALRTMFDVDLYDELSKTTNQKISILNDANAATIAEQFTGDAKGLSDYVLFSVGTGIGGGIVINDKVITGHTGMAGEFGFISLDTYNDSTKDFSLSRQGAIGGDLGGLIYNYHNKTGNWITGKDIFDLYDDGNETAVDEVNHFYLSLAQGIIDVIVTLDPEVVLVSGGITQRITFIDELNSKINEIIETRPRYKDLDFPPIKQAKLKSDAGIIGAAYQASKL
jgi:predicted NBD/HSP70 family sugar kinase